MFETAADTGKTIVTKREDISMDKSDVDTKILDAESYYDEDPDTEQRQVHYSQEASGTASIIYETTAGDQITDYTTAQTTSAGITQHQNDEEANIMTNSSSSKKRKLESWDDIEEDDNGDKFFSMSITCSLKRLSLINNLKAKVEIYQILEKYASKEKM